MQSQANTREEVVHRATDENAKGNVMAVGETISIAAIGKWLVGLVLAPWLWYERKRVDKLQVQIHSFVQHSQTMHYTKDETKEQIGLRLEPVHQKLDMIYDAVKDHRDNS